MCRYKQILTPGDKRHALVVIVDHDSQVIADTDITTPQHDVAKYPGLQRNPPGLTARTASGLEKAVQWPGTEMLQAGRDIQSDSMRFTRSDAHGTRAFIEPPADARIQGALRSLRCRLHT